MRLRRIEPADLVVWSPERRPQWGLFQAAHLLLGWKPPHVKEFKGPTHYFGALEPRPVAREVEHLYHLIEQHSEPGGWLRCRRMRIGQRDDVRPLRRVRPVEVVNLARRLGVPVHRHILKLVAQPRTAPAREAQWPAFLLRMYAELTQLRGASPIYPAVLRFAQGHPDNRFITHIDWHGGFIHRRDTAEPATIESVYRVFAAASRRGEPA